MLARLRSSHRSGIFSRVRAALASVAKVSLARIRASYFPATPVALSTSILRAKLERILFHDDRRVVLESSVSPYAVFFKMNVSRDCHAACNLNDFRSLFVFANKKSFVFTHLNITSFIVRFLKELSGTTSLSEIFSAKNL